MHSLGKKKKKRTTKAQLSNKLHVWVSDKIKLKNEVQRLGRRLELGEINF